MRVALVDADILAYQAAAASEQAIDWGEEMWTLHCFEPDAIATFNTIMAKIMERTEAHKAVLCYSDKRNWRKDVLPTYKQNRSGIRRPMLLSFLKEWSAEKYDVRQIEGLEGDDVIGLNATGKMGSQYVICSIDKDMKTIPGTHYNFMSDSFFDVTPYEADYCHLVQTLTGDATDGYAGCPGVGKVTAEKILAPFWDEGLVGAWQAIVQQYAKKGLGEEEALVQARVARILRHGEFNFETKQPILWTPSKQS